MGRRWWMGGGWMVFVIRGGVSGRGVAMASGSNLVLCFP